MKKIIKSIIITLFIMLIPTIVLAHQGKTDINGGHIDSSTSEYHYHHGYSAHKHINGLCPYETDFKELLPEKCPKCNKTVNSQNGLYCFECGYKLINLGNINMLMLVDGSEDKTRSEYFNEVQTLENKINNLNEQIIDKQNSINQLNNELSEKEDKLKSQKKDIIICFVIITIICVYIAYKIGKIVNEII